jgi:hypothetical protein
MQRRHSFTSGLNSPAPGGSEEQQQIGVAGWSVDETRGDTGEQSRGKEDRVVEPATYILK